MTFNQRTWRSGFKMWHSPDERPDSVGTSGLMRRVSRWAGAFPSLFHTPPRLRTIIAFALVVGWVVAYAAGQRSWPERYRPIVEATVNRLALAMGLSIKTWHLALIDEANRPETRNSPAHAPSPRGLLTPKLRLPPPLTADEIRSDPTDTQLLAEIKRLLAAGRKTSLLLLDISTLRETLAALPSVYGASVRKIYPSSLSVEVVQRRAVAMWQRDGKISIVDGRGNVVRPRPEPQDSGLPLVVGEGAGEAMAEILAVIARYPQLHARMHALNRIGKRRWDFHTRSGQTIRLPELGTIHALALLAHLHDRYALLDRPLEFIDLRHPDRIVIRRWSQLGDLDSGANDGDSSNARGVGGASHDFVRTGFSSANAPSNRH